MIRLALQEDVIDIFILLEKMHSEASTDYPAINQERAVKYISQHVTNKMCWVSQDKQGILNGTIGCYWNNMWFSDEGALFDAFFYVDSSVQHTGVGQQLLKKLKKFSNKHKQPLIMSVLDGRHVEAKDKFFNKAGFIRAGGIYTTKL
jgi:hypothetical protein